MFTQGRAVDSFFGNWLYERIIEDRPHLLNELARIVDFGFVNTSTKVDKQYVFDFEKAVRSDKALHEHFKLDGTFTRRARLFAFHWIAV